MTLAYMKGMNIRDNWLSSCLLLITKVSFILHSQCISKWAVKKEIGY